MHAPASHINFPKGGITAFLAGVALFMEIASQTLEKMVIALENNGGKPKHRTATFVVFAGLNGIRAVVRHCVIELVHAYSQEKAVLNAISRPFRPIVDSRTQ